MVEHVPDMKQKVKEERYGRGAFTLFYRKKGLEFKPHEYDLKYLKSMKVCIASNSSSSAEFRSSATVEPCLCYSRFQSGSLCRFLRAPYPDN